MYLTYLPSTWHWHPQFTNIYYIQIEGRSYYALAKMCHLTLGRQGKTESCTFTESFHTPCDNMATLKAHWCFPWSTWNKQSKDAQRQICNRHLSGADNAHGWLCLPGTQVCLMPQTLVCLWGPQTGEAVLRGATGVLILSSLDLYSDDILFFPCRRNLWIHRRPKCPDNECGGASLPILSKHYQ